MRDKLYRLKDSFLRFEYFALQNEWFITWLKCFFISVALCIVSVVFAWSFYIASISEQQRDILTEKITYSKKLIKYIDVLIKNNELPKINRDNQQNIQEFLIRWVFQKYSIDIDYLVEEPNNHFRLLSHGKKNSYTELLNSPLFLLLPISTQLLTIERSTGNSHKVKQSMENYLDIIWIFAKN